MKSVAKDRIKEPVPNNYVIYVTANDVYSKEADLPFE